MTKWKKNSWENYPILHNPSYDSQSGLSSTLQHLNKQPPLIFAREVDNLKKHLTKVQNREAFILQGGDCAESFDQYSADMIRDNLKILLQMAVVLTYGAGIPIIKIGRIAGQFAKPRSSTHEKKNDIELPSYFGDIINSILFEKNARQPDPKRMILAYNQSASSLNLLRAFTQGGFADLNQVHAWNNQFINNTRGGKKYLETAAKIDQTLNFMKACGITSEAVGQVKEIDFYISHEALLLIYEEALCRLDSSTKKHYATSAHFLWIGDRTRFIDSAHVEFLSGVQNPIGIKVGPTTDPNELIAIINKLNPYNESGKIVLIVRMGRKTILDKFPKILAKIDATDLNVVWITDPMHGNTIKAKNNYKTRKVDDIMEEVEKFFQIHKKQGSYAGGVHFEMTGQNVTECVGGSNPVSESDLVDRYHTHCDPRLNDEQALELSFLICDYLKKI